MHAFNWMESQEVKSLDSGERHYRTCQGRNSPRGDIERALVDMSRVIRPISLTELSIRAGDDGTLQVNIAGVTYYLPAKSVEVRMEPITPGTKKP